MSQPDRPRLSIRLLLALLLTCAAFSLPAAADDAGETTFDRNDEREWTDVNGVKLTGRFSGVIRDEVLINAGGRVTRVKLSTLSEADIAWLWGLHNQEGDLDQLPVEYREQPVVTEPEPPADEPPATTTLPDETNIPDESTTPSETAQPAQVDDAGAAATTDSADQNSGRTWTVNGNSIQGKFSGIIGTEVLINVNNRVQRHRLSELSEYDLAWLWDVYNALGKLDDLPIEYRERPANPMPPGSVGTSDTPVSDPANDALYAEDATREWANPDGDPFVARFEGFRGPDYLSLHDGSRSMRWSIDNLSQADVDWIRGYHAHHGIQDELAERLRPRTPNTPGSAVADLDEARTWTDRDGNTIQGSFASVSSEDVSIFRGHGIGWQSVPLAQLSRPDLIWLQSALRAEGRMVELPLVYRDPPDEDATDSELARERRQEGRRQWERYNGDKFVGTFDRVSEGIVHVHEHEAGPREEHWNDLGDEDHAYVKERLERETPAGFFPAQRDLALSQEEQAAGMRVWTDREGNQIVGSFSHLIAWSTVAVFDTSAGQASYIYEYLSNDDQELIQEASQHSQQVAQSGTSGTGYSSGYQSSQAPYNSGVGSYPSSGADPYQSGSVGQSEQQPISTSQPSGGFRQPGGGQPATNPTGGVAVPAQAPSAYQQGQQYGKYLGAIIGVVCLVLLIRKVSR